MGSIGAVLQIVVQRSLGNWRLLATVVAGVILSAGLMASVVLYSDAIRDLGLTYALRQQDPLKLDLRILSSSQPLRRQEYAIRRDRTTQLINRYAGDIARETVRYGRTATFFLTPPGQAVPEDQNRPRAHFQFADRLNDHVRLVDGRLPRAVEPPRDAKTPPTLEVLLGKAGAERLNVNVGQSYDLHPFWRPEAAPVKVTVVGLIEPINPAEEYWFGREDRFAVTTTTWPTYPFFTDERAFVEALAAYLPDIDGTFETFVFVDTGRIDSRNARPVENRLRTLSTALRESIERTSLETQLPETIATYRQKLFFTRLPLFALILQIVGIVIYYLVMVTTMLVERQAGEIALLKSRGASTLQLMAVYLLEGLILATIAVVAGPLLAAGAIALLGLTPPFSNLSQGGLLRVTLGGQAFGLAFLGAMLALAALLWPAYRASRYSIVHYKQHIARPPQQPVFLRYYLDLVVIAVAAFAFYQLRQRGSLVTERLFGELSADPLLLVTPTLFMLMIALVFLRLFPLALRGVSWLARGLDGAAVPLGLWHMVRSPLHYTRLILLLILATAVGMFAAGFRATLERSYADRAAYQAGAAARLESVRQPLNVPNEPFVAAIRQASGAADVSPAVRLNGSYSLGQFRSEDLTLLGVVPEQFGGMAFWRKDFSGGPLRDLLSKLHAPTATDTTAAAQVPPGARAIGLWAQSSLPPNVGQIGVRLQEPSGAFWEYRLLPDGAPTADGWQFFAADLAAPLGPGRAGTAGAPVPNPSLSKRLDSIFVRLSGAPAAPERASILIDDVQVTADPGAVGGWTVIEPFEDVDRYEVLSGAVAQADVGALSRAPVNGRSGQYAARLAFTRQRSGAPIVGLRPRGIAGGLPVLVSESFLTTAKKRVGDEITIYVNRQYVPARIAGSFDLFPTYDPAKKIHFMVADLAAVQTVAARVPSLADGAYPNEAWLDGLTGPITKDGLAAKGVNVERALDRETLRAEQAADPLVAASWEGILFLSFATVLLLTALGFIVYSYLTAQTRALEFAILRTMGFSSRQILALVTFEQCFVILAGIAAGTLLGLPLGRLMIGYMGITESGSAVLPPLVSRVSWTTVTTAYALLALMFAGTIAALALLYSRLAVHRALRMGEL
jgi:ABC-type lipoprotein release transport system permease subunit